MTTTRRDPVSRIVITRSPLRSAAQAKALDRHSIDVVGIPGQVLMEHAGRAVADVAVARATGGVVVVVCGGGNNGGDGFVCARHLLSRGVDVSVVATHPIAALQGDAAASAKLLLAAAKARGVDDIVLVLDDDADVGSTLLTHLADRRPAVIVDALFGIGLSRPLAGQAALVVEAVNAWRADNDDVAVIAVDIPSGLPTDGEKPAGVVVEADITVTFGGKKLAHAIEHGAHVCGEVVDVDIGFVGASDEGLAVFAVDDVQLPPADPRAYKKRFGHVGVVLGGDGTRGAALLSAHAAQRAGAGLVTLLGDSTMPRPIELMARDMDAGDGDGDDAAFDGLDAVVVGPGLPPKGALALRDRVRAARARTKGLLVVADAGALGAFVNGDADVWTPHPGEAARVLGSSSAEVEQDRVAAARALQKLLGGVVVLKGAAPIVASATALHVIPGGAAALGVAGAGDVLAGIIAAGLGGAFVSGTGVDIEATTIAAVWLHQQAGRHEARGLLASELADNVRGAVAVARG